MKQHEAVIRAMEQNGGFATLGHLYHAALKVPGCQWGTKTPFASIRRIVQTHSDLFFKIRPGLWALKAHEQQVLEQLSLLQHTSPDHHEEFNHSYYQGLIVQLGNLKNYETFVPHQDKNRSFLTHKLADVATLKQFHPFTYDHLLRRAKTVDVTWFGARKIPHSFFEVEHSTDIYNSLLKFSDFQDFRINFFIVAAAARRREFDRKISSHTFEPIREIVKFVDYEKISDWHSKISESAAAEKSLNL
ncbi:MAG TPA: hypothetical protein VGO91_10910 [Pyrinomonadaceae bacterium]|jgi:hypothetical protein|nr:hypothetical protein [Pyrinomonadaceae bacterium]